MASKIPHRPQKKPLKAHPFFKPKTAALSPAEAAIAGLTPDEVKKAFQKLFDAQQWQSARDMVLAFAHQHPNVAMAWSDAAACSVHLYDWTGAVEYGLKAHALDKQILAAMDAVSHGYAYQDINDKAGIYGHRALTRRDELFGHKIFRPWTVEPPPALSKDRTRNIIAFSLFGNNSKYCESGILNVVEQPNLYPDWTCRFYIDDTVPDHVVARLKEHGAQVIVVDDELKKWPAPMWRFAAYDDPQVDRVIFRDADSVISAREAGAVGEWAASHLPFHLMRDGGSHTELIMAGLWGIARGAMPPMHEMVADYLKVPPSSMHFADQFFLREYVWPYMRGQVMQHDSLFDFMSPRPFPEGPHRNDFHTGCTESAPSFETEVDKPDGTQVFWTIVEKSADTGEERQICRYEATVMSGKIRANIPHRYAFRINRDMLVRVEK